MWHCFIGWKCILNIVEQLFLNILSSRNASTFSTVILCTQSQWDDEPDLQLKIIYLPNRVHAAAAAAKLKDTL